MGCSVEWRVADRRASKVSLVTLGGSFDVLHDNYARQELVTSIAVVIDTDEFLVPTWKTTASPPCFLATSAIALSDPGVSQWSRRESLMTPMIA